MTATVLAASVGKNAEVHLQIAADDRTGALEVAAAIADRSGEPVQVAVWPDRPDRNGVASVTDLESRHLDPSEAARRAGALDGVDGAHKIDSTLRGNWASELAARHAATDGPILVVPALPGLGRTCLNGTVLLNGIPVHETAAGRDPRRPVLSSRPDQHLGRVGLSSIGLASVDEVESWCACPSGVAVADAGDQPTIERIVAAWRATAGVLLAGTSIVIAEAIDRQTVASIGLDGPLLVVLGSLHPVARRQVAVAVEVGVLRVAATPIAAATALAAGHHVVMSTPEVAGEVGHTEAVTAARELAESVASVVASVAPGALVVLGGDTAAALLGDAPMRVLGSLTPGSAVVDSPSWEVPVITRAGGFGGDSAVVELLWGTLPG